MIEEALQLIQQTAVLAKDAKEVFSDRGAHTKDILLPDGTVTKFTESTPPRNHSAFDIDSLARFIASDENVVVWHDDAKVIAILNDQEFRDSRVTMPLPIHPTFAALAACNKALTQKELIDFLRLNIKAEVERDVPALMSSLRDVKFVSNQGGTGTINHGRESMGRTIDQSVTGTDTLPEDFTINLRLWLHLDATVPVDCALIINTAEQTFKFGPKPGAVEQAKVAGQAWLGEQLTAACSKAAVFFGTPDAK